MNTKPSVNDEVEFKNRITEANNELATLCQKYEVRLDSRAFIDEEGKISATSIWLNTRGQNLSDKPTDKAVNGLSEA